MIHTNFHENQTINKDLQIYRVSSGEGAFKLRNISEN